MDWTLIIAAWGAVWATVALVWNLVQDRARRPRLVVRFAGVEHRSLPNGSGGSVVDESNVWALKLQVVNVSEEVPLTIVEAGYRRRGQRRPIACDYRGPTVYSSLGTPHSVRCPCVTLLASEADVVYVRTEGLAPSTELTGIYMRCSRGRVAWLSGKVLRQVLAAHSWPPAVSASVPAANQ